MHVLTIPLDAAKSGGGRQSVGVESNGDRNDPGDGKTCFIKGFDTSMDEDSLKQAITDAFGEYGEVERVGLPFDRENQCLKGFGFVVFTEANGATVRCLRCLCL